MRIITAILFLLLAASAIPAIAAEDPQLQQIHQQRLIAELKNARTARDEEVDSLKLLIGDLVDASKKAADQATLDRDKAVASFKSEAATARREIYGP